MEAYRLLMLEDSPYDAELIQYLLKKQGYEASYCVAAGRAEFSEALEHFQPTIILSDNALPDINAREALTISREKWPYIPFIMVSGTVSEEFATDLIRAGGDDYILKDRLTRLPLAIDTAIKKRNEEKEKAAALDMLRENEEKYRTLVERVTDAFISLDNNFCCTFLNHQACELIRKNPLELIGKNIWDVFPDVVGSHTYHSFYTAMREQRYTCSVDYYEPLDLWLENHIYPSIDGLSVFIRNISEQKKTQIALQKVERQIMEEKLVAQNTMTKAILRAQENERNRLGLELHDNINQMLAASMLSLEKASKLHPEIVNDTLAMLHKTIGEIRLLSSRCVTPLKDMNFEEQIQQLLNQFRNITGIQTELLFSAEAIDDDDLKLNLYRILQEGLNNISKYAKATQVSIVIESDEDHLQIILQDNGVGFDTSIQRMGIGISNIIHRAEIFNGTASITSSPGNGCCIRIRVNKKQQGIT